MAGYSGTPLPNKLGLKEGSTVIVWGAPEDVLMGMPAGVTVKASGVITDITDHVVREVALPLGLVDNKVCAIDDTWTGLRLVWRTGLRG